VSGCPFVVHRRTDWRSATVVITRARASGPAFPGTSRCGAGRNTPVVEGCGDAASGEDVEAALVPVDCPATAPGVDAGCATAPQRDTATQTTIKIAVEERNRRVMALIVSAPEGNITPGAIGKDRRAAPAERPSSARRRIRDVTRSSPVHPRRCRATRRSRPRGARCTAQNARGRP
jgi:hypothetical protein